ncbi:MAG: acetate/propionate family kinase [Burkholderiaceae bacterium]|nr:acetate/propionate family kinase [Burkholderiaceae bacterium]
MTILVLNSGSSSIKFATYDRGERRGQVVERLRGQVSGLPDSAALSWRAAGGAREERKLSGNVDSRAALEAVLAHVGEAGALGALEAVGHRIAHGGQALIRPVRIDDEVLALIESLTPLAPLHQGFGIAGVRAMQALAPHALQVACFDTAFHATQPALHTTMPLPASWRERGARRYGFHGLSFEWIAQKLPQLLGAAADARVIVAHLGSGASVCGMRERRSVRTSMGLSTLGGLMMSTRPGDLDPGVLLFLQQQLHVDVDEVSRGLHRESGLFGLSGLSGDMRALEASDDPRAGFAIEMLCQRAAQEIAATAVAIGGCDALVFTGGIGEHSERTRREISALLGWMGVRLDPALNRANGPRVHAADSTVAVCVVPTDEEQVVAAHVAAMMSQVRQQYSQS